MGRLNWERCANTSSLSDASKPIRDVAYETLKHAIITGEIPAGSRIVETVYASRLHISRTPLREAFRQLELDGLVTSQARKGVIVRAFTMDDIEEIFTIRNADDAAGAFHRGQHRRGNAEQLDEILARMDISQREADADALAEQTASFTG